MTNQEAFDVMVRHLRKQGCKSVNKRNTCLYRGPNGLRCAVGALIPDEQYSKSFEKKSAGYVASRVPAMSGVDNDLLYEMQSIHDDLAPARWECEFSNVASAFRLKLPRAVNGGQHA